LKTWGSKLTPVKSKSEVRLPPVIDLEWLIVKKDSRVSVKEKKTKLRLFVPKTKVEMMKI